MKLRNKKTGEIKEVQPLAIGGFRSLAELNKEWEDYDEKISKEYWFIDTYEGTIVEKTIVCFETTDKERKEIGNYFETKEEAERAVEKLKAWKRLKDKGFRFDDWHPDVGIGFELWNTELEKESVRSDLDLLFGGEK